MRRHLIAALVAAAAATTATTAPVAWAVTPGAVTCQKVNPRTGQCVIQVGGPGGSGSKGGAGPAAGPETVTPPGCFSDWTEQTVPCSSAEGAWSDARDCYVRRLDPQPPMSSFAWEGHTDGAIYTCTPDQTRVGSTLAYSFWSATPPDAPDPAQLAQQAVAAMDLSAVTIGIVPSITDGGVGLVGLPTWMWVVDPTPSTWGPITRSASAGGITVTASATVQGVVWDMGDTTAVTCTTAGTPYQDRFGDQPSPDCGHRYTRTSVGQVDDAYPVTATSRWTIDWAGGGARGRIEQNFTARTTVRIGELQVLVIR